MMMLHALLFRYSDIPLEEIQKICPACRGTCNCKVCLRGDNLIKVFQFSKGLAFISIVAYWNTKYIPNSLDIILWSPD